MTRRVLIGCVSGIVALFPAAFLVTLFYRFPFPLAGYESGLSAALRSPVAVLMYGILIGLFPVAGVLGALAAWAAARFTPADGPRQWVSPAAMGICTAFLLTGVLSVWDKVYGPW
jgi:hypothetical protein